MTKLLEVDRVEIQILVDNVTDTLSSTPAHVESEGAGLMRRGVRVMGGKCLCCAAHGLSCLLRIEAGGVARTLLFDTGPEEYAFERNVTRLAAELGAVEEIVLSHGHWDHAGALLLALTMIRGRNGGKPVGFHGHPDMFRTRAVTLPNGGVRQMEDIPSIADLTAFGAEVTLAREPQAILEGMVHVSGEVPRVTDFERGYPGQVRRKEVGEGWEPDELLIDERWIGVNVRGKGLVILSACSHAGIVNVMTHALRAFRACRSMR